MLLPSIPRWFHLEQMVKLDSPKQSWTVIKQNLVICMMNMKRKWNILINRTMVPLNRATVLRRVVPLSNNSMVSRANLNKPPMA